MPWCTAYRRSPSGSSAARARAPSAARPGNPVVSRCESRFRPRLRDDDRGRSARPGVSRSPVVHLAITRLRGPRRRRRGHRSACRGWPRMLGCARHRRGACGVRSRARRFGRRGPRARHGVGAGVPRDPLGHRRSGRRARRDPPLHARRRRSGHRGARARKDPARARSRTLGPARRARRRWSTASRASASGSLR